MGKKSGSSASSNKDDTKLQAQLAKLHAVTVDNVAEANFFKEDGNVMHFNKVGVQVAPQHNTSVFYGMPQEKGLQELFPNIISQMGPEAIQALTQLSAQLQQAQNAGNAGAGAAGDGKRACLERHRALHRHHRHGVRADHAVRQRSGAALPRAVPQA